MLASSIRPCGLDYEARRPPIPLSEFPEPPLTLWGQGKDAISVNKQYARLDDQVKSFVAHLSGLSNKEALQTSGVLSENFWLKPVLSKNFSGPALDGHENLIFVCFAWRIYTIQIADLFNSLQSPSFVEIHCDSNRSNAAARHPKCSLLVLAWHHIDMALQPPPAAYEA